MSCSIAAQVEIIFLLSLSIIRLCVATYVGKDIHISDNVKEFLENEHNNLRYTLSPPPRYMEEVIWSEELANHSANWSSQCQYTKSSIAATPARYRHFCSQIIRNLDKYSEEDSWTETLQYWSLDNEAEGGRNQHWRYGEGKVSDIVDHERVSMWTQMIWPLTNELGCSVSQCTGSDQSTFFFLVCTYCPGSDTLLEQLPAVKDMTVPADVYAFPYVATCNGCPVVCTDMAAIPSAKYQGKLCSPPCRGYNYFDYLSICGAKLCSNDEGLEKWASDCPRSCGLCGNGTREGESDVSGQGATSSRQLLHTVTLLPVIMITYL